MQVDPRTVAKLHHQLHLEALPEVRRPLLLVVFHAPAGFMKRVVLQASLMHARRASGTWRCGFAASWSCASTRRGRPGHMQLPAQARRLPLAPSLAYNMLDTALWCAAPGRRRTVSAGSAALEVVHPGHAESHG